MVEKVHVLSNNGTFVFRFNNGEFGSKWCGMWKKDIKYFDYFAFKLNGEFISSANSKGFDFYNSQYAVSHFRMPAGDVTEETVCADGFIIVTVKPSFDAEIEAEIGVNIRDRSEGYSPDKRYEIKVAGKKTEVTLSGRSTYIIQSSGDFMVKESYGVHSPGMYSRSMGFSGYFDDAAPQNKYVPGLARTSVKAGEEFSIILSVKDMDNESSYKIFKNRLYQVKEYNSLIKSVYSHMWPNNVFSSELLNASIDALYSFSNFPEKELYAGFPIFNQFWLRDALIVLPSFLSINNPIFVKSVLSKVASMIKPAGLPNFAGGDIFPMDVPPLFVIAVYEYYRWTGDADFVKGISSGIKSLLKVGVSRIENGLVHDYGLLTWMDTIKREYSIEIQALWAKALDCAGELLKFSESDSSWTLSSLASILRSISRFDRTSYISDQLNSDINSVNQVFLPFYGVSDSDMTAVIMKNAEMELFGDNGVTSVAKSDKTFDPKGYHNGAIWPFTTAMLCGAAYSNGMTDLGRKCAAVLEKNLDAQCSSRINEIYQPDGKPEGCPSQAWSIGTLPYILDRHVLGIEVNAPLNKITVRKPEPLLIAERTLLINKNAVKISFSKGMVASNKKIEDKGEFFEITF